MFGGASGQIAEGYKVFHKVVGFSATMKPFDYYTKHCGIPADEVLTAEFESPFPRGNRKLLVIPVISAKFSQRERNYGKIQEAIERILGVAPRKLLCSFRVSIS